MQIYCGPPTNEANEKIQPLVTNLFSARPGSRDALPLVDSSETPLTLCPHNYAYSVQSPRRYHQRFYFNWCSAFTSAWPAEVSGVMSLDGWTVDLEDWDAEPVISWEEHLRCGESHRNSRISNCDGEQYHATVERFNQEPNPFLRYGRRTCSSCTAPARFCRR